MSGIAVGVIIIERFSRFFAFGCGSFAPWRAKPETACSVRFDFPDLRTLRGRKPVPFHEGLLRYREYSTGARGMRKLKNTAHKMQSILSGRKQDSAFAESRANQNCGKVLIKKWNKDQE